MQLVSFKIENFRSIVDSGWIPFSPDGITVLVGQNESGKSSILEALYFALSNETPTADDFRTGAALPSVSLGVRLTADDIDNHLELNVRESIALKRYVESIDDVVKITCRWDYRAINGAQTLEQVVELHDERPTEFINSAIREAQEAEALVAEQESVPTSPQQAPDKPEAQASATTATSAPTLEPSNIGECVWRALPLGILFNEASGRLPSQVDIDEKGQPKGEGARAALNFLQIAEINLPELLKGDRRARENTLNKANSRVSKDFNAFWSQTIGKSGKLSLKCNIDHYGTEVTEKAGKAHLVFWVSDGNTQLYLKQRSQGVRWFVSFYLQLKASEKGKNRRVFLLDEPGANLHSKAQGDVLKLVNRLGKNTSTVVYSTHSPQMIEYSKLFRVHAVQRDGDLDESPTQIIDAHRLGTASTDTLSPILTAMGADLAQHQVIRKQNNVLLEEMSGYYYVSSFWKLMGLKEEAHFIAATGVNKIEALANMFRGWGLDFIVAVDDDKQGREAYKSMKRELFGDDDALASRKMVRWPDCAAIEDVLCKNDFAKFVLEDEKAVITGTNGEYVKSASRSKPVLAFRFALAVTDGKVSFDMLSNESKVKLKTITDAIRDRLVPA